ncbi:ABC transporter permease [Vibrio sp. 10N.261.55.A7]|uniref:ABC transporter permease n=1 Tax=Vibrio sp. 10N.261.55.A7 TaxID=1880851 RepID=UPI000C85AD66|nr:ABC transporter permease [Vibrio sp. 10N.261.55.A7]PMK03890.1 ABC transporter permease [Vibrio sp. 10N.261.55.A7]
MESIVDISFLQLALFSSTLLIPIFINVHYQLDLGKDIFLSITRMVIQLIAIGIYLEYLFSINSLAINLIWIAIMIVIGSLSIIGKAKLPTRFLFKPVSSGLLLGLSPILILLCFVFIQPKPVYNAQYLIPLAGMLLGNSLSGNIIALQNLFTAYESRRSEYEAALSLGASPTYASMPFLREAIQKSFAPVLASMATTGLVTLPGMMTGQILGGIAPMTAIKYQLMIMIAIFVMMSISVTLSLRLSLNSAISSEGRILINRIDASKTKSARN